MSADLIIYDRIWLQEYIEHISHEKRMACELYDALQAELYRTSAAKRLFYEEALAHTRDLIESRSVNGPSLVKNLERVAEAAMHLQRKCVELEIPDLFK